MAQENQTIQPKNLKKNKTKHVRKKAYFVQFTTLSYFANISILYVQKVRNIQKDQLALSKDQTNLPKDSFQTKVESNNSILNQSQGTTPLFSFSNTCSQGLRELARKPSKKR